MKTYFLYSHKELKPFPRCTKTVAVEASLNRTYPFFKISFCHSQNLLQVKH